MARPGEAKAGQFFASRSGVCIYVTIQRRAFRIQFDSIDAQGVVAEGPGEGAEAAIDIARAELAQNAANVAPLFAKVTRPTM
jgi:hypothetical protein